jgi:uncharacterized protein (TIGR04222 family)
MRRVTDDAVALVAVTAPVVVAALAGVRWHEGWRRGPARTPSAAELAMVAGGDRRTLLSALAALRQAGAIHAVEDGLLLATGPLPADADRLQRAVHAAARANRELPPPRRGAFGYGHGRLVPTEVGAAVVSVRRSARRAGWIVAPPGGPPAGRACLPVVVVPLLAASYVGALVAASRLWQLGDQFFRGIGPVLVLAAYLVLGFFLSDLPTRTRSGERLLRQARDSHRRLATDGSVRTPEAAALSVALGGEAALQALDPEFARRLGVTAAGPPADGGRDGGGGSG